MFFSTAINMHASGVLELLLSKREGTVLPDRSRKSALRACRRFFGKALRYYGREFVVFPALAGPFFWKTLLGNALSEGIRDVYAGAVIYCGHVGGREYAPATRAGGRANFYRMQVESSCNFEVPLVLSILAGGLDRQIEHHLFPRLPPNRLREIAPRVRQICEEHGVRYQTAPWSRRLREVLGALSRLRRDSAVGPLPAAGLA
jgi:linoleoyl-CoA desaturase